MELMKYFLLFTKNESQCTDCVNIIYKQERRNNKLYNLKPNLIIVYLVAIMKRFSGLFSKMNSTSIHQRSTYYAYVNIKPNYRLNKI